jgi:hypothetical protein
MTELFFESPVTLAVTGIVFVVMALIVWIKAGYSAALYTAIGLVIATIALVLLSLQIQTDREAVQSVLDNIASAVQRNDISEVLSYIHPSATEGVRKAESEFPNYHFTEARITGIKSIEVDNRTQPPSAIAEFYVAVSASANGMQANGIRRFVRTYFVKRDGKWLVHDYQHFDVGQSLKNPDIN